MDDYIDITRRNFDSFLGKLKQQLQESVSVKDSTFLKLDRYGLAQIGFKRQTEIGELAQSLKNEMGVNILYLMSHANKRDHQAVVYSLPYDDELYVIQLESHTFGTIEQMTVMFYESLDIMFKHVNQQYQSLTDESWEIQQMESPEEVFFHFVH